MTLMGRKETAQYRIGAIEYEVELSTSNTHAFPRQLAPCSWLLVTSVIWCLLHLRSYTREITVLFPSPLNSVIIVTAIVATSQ